LTFPGRAQWRKGISEKTVPREVRKRRPGKMGASALRCRASKAKEIPKKIQEKVGKDLRSEVGGGGRLVRSGGPLALRSHQKDESDDTWEIA